MQTNIDSLTQWVVESGMSFNIDKCFSVTFGQSLRYQIIRRYSIGSVTIPLKIIFKDLVGSVSNSLSFSTLTWTMLLGEHFVGLVLFINFLFLWLLRLLCGFTNNLFVLFKNMPLLYGIPILRSILIKLSEFVTFIVT